MYKFHIAVECMVCMRDMYRAIASTCDGRVVVYTRMPMCRYNLCNVEGNEAINLATFNDTLSCFTK
jgi:hypothetical protein